MKARLTILILLTVAAASARAGNIDLSTVPRRDTVSLTIYNSEDLTLVRETRMVTFKKGINPLQFSWANTLIDPSSVELKFRNHADQLDILDTTFPRDRPQMLYWNVQSNFDGDAAIEITYFTSGITWKADYTCIADRDEKQLSFQGFVRVFNNSGEEYDHAQIRLVVGTINLVEKIAQLAQIPIDKVRELSEPQGRVYRHAAAKKSMALNELADGDRDGLAADRKAIIKEGLSEYFIYTIEGTETISNGWSKRLRSIEPATVPLRIQYRYRPVEYGDQLVRMYLLTNDLPSKLGTTPLPDGVVRVFRENGRGGLGYVTAQSIKYVPIGDKIELNLGSDPEVVFELIKLRSFRDNIWLQLHGIHVMKRVDDLAAKIDVNSTVAGWDDHVIYTQRVRNYAAKPIDLEFRRSFPGQVKFRSRLGAVLHDYQTVQFGATVAVGARSDLLFEVTTQHGRDSNQNNITLENSEVRP